MKHYKQNNTTYARPMEIQTPEEYQSRFLKDFRSSEGLALILTEEELDNFIPIDSPQNKTSGSLTVTSEDKTVDNIPYGNYRRWNQL